MIKEGKSKKEAYGNNYFLFQKKQDGQFFLILQKIAVRRFAVFAE
jgi:hypothetical protein